MDLYHIPGDTGGMWRLDKFVEYQHEVPSIHYRVLGTYIKHYIHSKDEAVMMCWYMSVTYNEVTCALLHELIRWRKLTPDSVTQYCKQFWSKYKDVLDFGSSRKYAKNMDWFPELIEQFIRVTKKHPYKWLMSHNHNSSEQTYRNIYKSIKSLKFTGRFATDLFMESIMYLKKYFELNISESISLDWDNCANLTSGLLNIFYQDEQANEYDRYKKLPQGITEEYLTEKLSIVRNRIIKTYPE